MSNNIIYYKSKLQFFQEGKEDGRIEPSAADKIIKMIQETIDKIEKKRKRKNFQN